MSGQRPFLARLHPLWRRLPPDLRRGLYGAVTGRLAPDAAWSPRTPTNPREPYLVAGPLSAPTGLGQAGRLVLHALIAAGREVSALDLGPALMQPQTVALPPLPLPRPGPGTLLLMSQPPTVAHSLAAIGRRLLRDKLRVGLWAWEIDRLPPVWLQERRFVHAVAAPSRFTQGLFEAGWGEPVRLTPWPLAACPPPARLGRVHAGVTFGTAMDLGSTLARKNPFAVVAAFRAAFTAQDDVRLLVKLRDPGSAPHAARDLAQACAAPGAPVAIETATLSPAALEAWWAQIDVFVSLHRSEGFGLLPAEAMQRGLPVIATDWSATTDFLDPETGWPVAARRVPARDETGRYALPGATWAEPEPEAAVAALRAAAADPEAARRRGAAAAERIARAFSGAAFLRGLEGEPSVR